MVEISVCVITYNQEKYVSKCINSILNQDIDVPFEIIIGDDCSTDQTRNILLNLEKVNPEKIRLVFHESNVGATKNIHIIRAKARGRYIFHCDGDDWYYPNKLSVQYGFMDQNQQYFVCWSSCDNYNECGNTIIGNQYHGNNLEITLEDILAFGSWGIHSSLMFRRTAASVNIGSTSDLYDFDISIRLLELGRGVLLGDKLLAYRSNSHGSATRHLISNRLNHQRIHQITRYAAYISENPKYRQILGFFSLLTLIRVLIKREKLIFIYIKYIYLIFLPNNTKAIALSIIKMLKLRGRN